MSQDYIPGTCNIGPAEIKQRQLFAIAGLIITGISLFYLITSDSDRSERLVLFVPLIFFAVGFIQSRKKFCLAFGFLGTFNFGQLGQVAKVADPIAKKADRKTALIILLQSISLAAALTLAIYLLPF